MIGIRNFQLEVRRLIKMNTKIEEEKSADIKLIVIGDAAVGKSKFIARFLEDEYNSFRSSTKALDLYQKEMDVDGEKVTVDIYDTAGQEKYESLHASYYFQAHACIMLFDVTRKATYTNLKKWHGEVKKYCEDIPIVLVANKVDMNASITRKNFKFAENNNIPLYFTSCADGTNVVSVFREAVCLAVGHKRFGSKSIVDEALEILEDQLFIKEKDSIDEKGDKDTKN